MNEMWNIVLYYVVFMKGEYMEEKRKGKIGTYLYEALLMSVVSYAIAMLITSTNRSIVITVVAAAVILFLVDCICFRCIRRNRLGTRVIIVIVLGIVNGVATLFVAIYCLAPTLLFWPSVDQTIYDEVASYPAIEAITLDSNEGELSGWMLHNAEDGAPLIIYYGGNGETASRRMRNIHEQEWDYLFEGYNFVMMNYPGYETSEGGPSDHALKTMGLAVYDGLSKRQDVNPEQIYIWGYSIGTGVSNYVASQRSVKGLLLMAPYSSGFDLYNNFVNIFYGPLRALVDFDMASEEFATKISVKPTILASKKDEIVGYWTSKSLSEQYPKGCNFLTLEDIGHNDFWINEGSRSMIQSYFKEELGQ